MSGSGGESESVPQYNFVTVTTQIKSQDLVKTWEDSEAYQEYVGFILAIGDTIKGKKLREADVPSDACQRLLGLLSSIRLLCCDSLLVFHGPSLACQISVQLHDIANVES